LAEILLATRSEHKAAEVFDVLRSAASVSLTTLADLGIAQSAVEDDVEKFPTSLDNAVAKGRYFAQLTGRLTLADDSGLVVDALGGKPGARTKRFALDHGRTVPGGKQLDDANNDLLLELLGGVPDDQRGARYVCAAALVWPNGDAVNAIGTCAGMIAHKRIGDGGFGYDPLFFIPDLGVTFAQLTRSQKNQRSHRALAFRALAPHLR
jgi:XTP/dITP diphosphohydrolase